MDDGTTGDRRFYRSVQRARATAAAHPAVTSIAEPTFAGNSAQLELTIQVPFPNAWKVAGKSPNGVRRFEPIRLDFSHRFPVDPPEVSLRPDFGRGLAHLQPWTTEDGRPVPCIQDAQISEFFQQQGISGLLNQTVSWLDHAAEGVLIDPKQGWEPTRRDFVDDFIVSDADSLRSVVDRRGGIRFFKYEYIRLPGTSERGRLHGQILDEQVPLNVAAAKGLFKEGPFGLDGGYRHGQSVAVLVWPGKGPSGKEKVCDVYAPESVHDLGSLKARAALFGCHKELLDAMAWLRKCAREYKKAGPFSLAIVLCVRRPFHLISSKSRTELCSYLVDFYAGEVFPEGDETPVHPAGHRDHISQPLLSRMANVDIVGDRPEWTLIGAGSLGSKVALHMARAGLAPSSIVDTRSMSPHNAARHALIPRGDDMQILFMDAKSRLLRDALKSFAQSSTSIARDIVDVLNTRSLAKDAWSRRSWAVVNTTASLRVRAALAAASALSVRVIEGLLYTEGELGLITTEGPKRNPDTQDLIAAFYAHCCEDSDLQSVLFGSTPRGPSRMPTGEGCGSVTMRMSDGRVSLFGAALAEYLLSCQQHGLPAECGELVIGQLADNGLGVAWCRVPVRPVTVIKAENGTEWAVRIHSSALDKINQEVRRWPRDETGGVLIGRQEEATHAFHIVDVIEAPPDSKRSPSEFVLGKIGLKKSLEAYALSSDWSLYCLGTWHSHLAPRGPSNTDRATARAVALARLAPSILLIHTPRGLRALMADRADLIREEGML